MNKHTPGRWEYVEGLGEVWAKHDEREDFRVAIVEDSDADGLLMAAAPELLATCEAAVAHVLACLPPEDADGADDEDCLAQWVHDMRRAIAKAKGES